MSLKEQTECPECGPIMQDYSWADHVYEFHWEETRALISNHPEEVMEMIE